MKLLVTGARGLIGRHVVAAALNHEDIDVVASSQTRPEVLAEGVAFVGADLLSSNAVDRLIDEARPTHLVHCAWETRHPTYWEAADNTAWATAAAHLADAFKRVGGKRFVQVGSCAEYGWNGQTTVPETAYGKAKRDAFVAIEERARGAFEAVEARIFFVYGPGENPARYIPYICRSHLAGESPKLSSGRQVRDLLHASDAANALCFLARCDDAKGVVDIGTGDGRTLAEVATLLAQIAGKQETGLGRKPDRPGDPPEQVADAMALRAMGWAPRLSLEEGLRDTYAWWSDQLAVHV